MQRARLTVAVSPLRTSCYSFLGPRGRSQRAVLRPQKWTEMLAACLRRTVTKVQMLRWKRKRAQCSAEWVSKKYVCEFFNYGWGEKEQDGLNPNYAEAIVVLWLNVMAQHCSPIETLLLMYRSQQSGTLKYSHSCQIITSLNWQGNIKFTLSCAVGSERPVNTLLAPSASVCQRRGSDVCWGRISSNVANLAFRWEKTFTLRVDRFCTG